MEPPDGSASTEADDLIIDLTDRVRESAAGQVDVWSDEYRTPEYIEWAIESLREEFGGPDQPFGVYYVDGRDPRSSLGRAVEVERFGDSFANDIEMLRGLYGGFEQAGTTEIICVVDHVNHKPCGVIRTVTNTAEHGCRILNDLQSDGENGWGLTWDDIVAASDFAATRPEEIVDIPTIAVAKGYQGASKIDGVSKALYVGVTQQALRSDAVTWVCSLERIPYILVQASTHDVMHEFDGVPAHAYYGAPDTVPLWANFREYEAFLRVKDPRMHAAYTRGAGLDQYFFGFHGEPTWEPMDIIDLRTYDLSPTDAGSG